MDDQVLTAAPGHILFRSGTPGLGFEVFLLAEIERIQGSLDLENDITTPAPIASIRPAARDVFFPAKVNHPIAAFTGCDLNFYLIYEHAAIISFAIIILS